MKQHLSFPPKPPAFFGRRTELRTLVSLVEAEAGAKIALVGSGGSGKSTLAAALGHTLRRHFQNNIHWFRIGAWDSRTLFAMMAHRFRLFGSTSSKRASQAKGSANAMDTFSTNPRALLQRHFKKNGPHLIVLDNHEDDAATAALLDALQSDNVTWIITARRCLLGGVTVFPVVPPLVTVGQSPFPTIATMTRLLRWNPVALDIANALVENNEITADALGKWLKSKGILRVRPVEHEDDLPEVALLVERAWNGLAPEGQRMLGVLAHMGGDHMDDQSLGALASTKTPLSTAEVQKNIARLLSLRLMQEPIKSRYTLHATVRHAVLKRTAPLPERLFEHYVSLLEASKERIEIEQTHLFAAMDYAQETSDLQKILRVQKVTLSL